MIEDSGTLFEISFSDPHCNATPQNLLPSHNNDVDELTARIQFDPEDFTCTPPSDKLLDGELASEHLSHLLHINDIHSHGKGQVHYRHLTTTDHHTLLFQVDHLHCRRP